MGATSQKPYAVVSCHVERPLDNRVWAAFSKFQERRPGGFAIAALLRPPDVDADEDPELWALRAREAAARGPLGHHTHWTSPTHARPTSDRNPGSRVLREGAWMAARGLVPTLFCGGGWYTDESVASACAKLGYVDCTPRATRPSYLPPGAAWAELAHPTRIRLPSATLLAVPTTLTIGDLARRALARAAIEETVAHVYFHDTDLLDVRRRTALVLGLRALARRRRASDLDAVAAEIGPAAPERGWAEVARGEGARGDPQ